MINLRKASERGQADYGWLQTNYTFSFADYHDPKQMGFSVLRVMNEDIIAADQGFGTHPHRNAEIITYVLDGELEHRDSMGNGSILKAGELQRMSAGSGVTHSEFNPSKTRSTHLYQIWLRPSVKDIEPSYEEKSFLESERKNNFRLVASPNAENGSLSINQDVKLYLASIDEQRELKFELKPSRQAWVQVISGELELNDQRLKTSDGAAISQESELVFVARTQVEVMLFDLP